MYVIQGINIIKYKDYLDINIYNENALQNLLSVQKYCNYLYVQCNLVRLLENIKYTI